LPGVIHAAGDGREWAFLCEDDSFEAAVRASGGEVVESAAPTLEAIFVARASA
jgi:hypothetical protein